MSHIYLAIGHQTGNEKRYIEEAFNTNWIAPLGPNVDAFEKDMSSYLGMKYGAATSSGTAAIHLALIEAGVNDGDTVISSDLTFIATCNPAMYERAKLVFVDSDMETFNMDPVALEKALKAHPETKAVIIVHLYGQTADMDRILEICKRYNVTLIEDAAESLGASYKGKKCGTFGKYSAISFNGNKIITTSGGGMIFANSEEEIKHIRFLSTQARDPALWYQHSQVGFNYRMSNICAGIGRGQFPEIDKRVARKREIYLHYYSAFMDDPKFHMMPIDAYGSYSNCWLSAATIDPSCKVNPVDLINELARNDIESRPMWKPMHMQPLFKDNEFFYAGEKPNDEDIFNLGICLPSDILMTVEQQDFVIKVIKDFLNK